MAYIIQAICSMGLSPMELIPDGQPANAHTSVRMQWDTKWGQSCFYPLIHSGFLILNTVPQNIFCMCILHRGGWYSILAEYVL